MSVRAAKTGNLPKEFALAAACAIWPPSERRVEAVRRAAAEVEDWGRFRRVVARHRIVGLAYDGIVAARLEPPPPVLGALRGDAQALARQSLGMAAEAIRLRHAFADAGIPVAFLKGATLAMLAYGSLGIRHSKDIDVLVPEECVAAAAATLSQRGYARTAPRADVSGRRLQIWMKRFKHFTFRHGERGIEVGLHWRLSDNPLLAQVPAPQSWREVPIAGLASLPTLDRDDLFAYLCIHGAYHAWFRLKWLADIGALLEAAPHGEAQRLLSGTASRDAARPAAQAALLAQRVLGTTLTPSPVPRDDRVVPWIVTMAFAAMTRGDGELEPQQLAFGSILIKASEYLLKGWRFKLAQAGRDFVSFEDWQLVPLPDRYVFLYPLLRLPLWLWRHAVLRHRGRPQS